MSRIRMMASLLIVVLLGLAAEGCLRRGWRGRGYRFRPGVGAAIAATLITAAIVGRAVAVAAHDAHFHAEHCGHHRRWHDGRWVYHYNDRWEYHEGGSWYAYPPSPPPPPEATPAPAAQPAPPPEEY